MLLVDDLNDIRKNIGRSLADTFQMMFRMDIYLLSETLAERDPSMVHSYLTLTHKDMEATLSISLTHAAVEHIADTLEPGVEKHSEAIIQDVVCEVTNIVGNHLRTYLCDKGGNEFKLSLPHKGLYVDNGHITGLATLFFRLEQQERLMLSLGLLTSDTSHKHTKLPH